MPDLGRPLRWFMRVVREADRGEPVPITIERNREAAVEMGAQNPPDVPLYRFRLGLRAGFSGEQSARIPVFKKVNPNPHPVLKEIFYCEVAGSELEAANVHALHEKVARMLETLAPGGSLPLAYFRVPAADYSLPIYEQGGKLVSPMIAGADLKAPDLAGIRRNVCRHLVNAGYVNDPSEVEIEVVRPSDLKLVSPAALIRSLEDPDLWLAAVEGRSSEGLVIGLLGEATELKPEQRRRAGAQPLSSPPAASDVASLLRLVGNELADAKQLEEPFALYATQVRPEIWSRTEELTDDLGHRLVCWLEGGESAPLELPLRRTAAGELLTALEDDGITVFAAADEQLLKRSLGRYLSGSGFLRFEDAVEFVPGAGGSEPPPPPEGGWKSNGIEFSRLDFGDGDRTNEEEVTLS
jgi:hypothetical protein